MASNRREILFAGLSSIWLSACGGGDDAAGQTGGVSWTVASRRQDADSLGNVCHGNGVFVAVGTAQARSDRLNQAMSYSDDGQVWVPVPLPLEGGDDAWLVACAFGNGRFIAITTVGEIFTSANGRDWQLAINTGLTSLDALTFGNGRFLATGTVGLEAVTLSSIDGLVWSAPNHTGVGFILSPINFANGAAYAFPYNSGGRDLYRSADSGLAWAPAEFYANGQPMAISDMVYANGVYVAATDNGHIYTSTDLATWTMRSAFAPTNYTRLAYLSGRFVLTNGRTIAMSSDGVAWNATVIGQTGDILDSVSFAGTRFVAVGHPGLVAIGTPR
jgi:hypothetical protein